MKTFLKFLSFGMVMFILGTLYTSYTTNQAITDKEDYIRLTLDATAYSPSPHITQGDPFQMASGKYATPRDLWQLKYVALSRDLLKQYNIKYGDKIYLEFEVQDTMAARMTDTVDLFMRNLQLAREFGRQERDIIIVRKN